MKTSGRYWWWYRRVVYFIFRLLLVIGTDLVVGPVTGIRRLFHKGLPFRSVPLGAGPNFGGGSIFAWERLGGDCLPAGGLDH